MPGYQVPGVPHPAQGYTRDQSRVGNRESAINCNTGKETSNGSEFWLEHGQ